jgi:hypothetical protein
MGEPRDEVCVAVIKPLEVPVPQKGASSPEVILGSVTFSGSGSTTSRSG